MKKRSHVQEIIIEEASARKRTLSVGLFNGLTLVVIGVVLNRFYTATTTFETLKWSIVVLAALAVFAEIGSLYALVVGGMIARDGEEEFLYHHTIFSIVSFGLASYALLVLLAVGASAGAWWYVTVIAVELGAFLLIIQGLRFVHAAHKQYGTPDFVI